MNLLSHTVTQIKPYDATFTPLACSPGEKPEGYALSADEKTLYVTCRWSNTLVAIDTATMQVTNRAPSRDDATRLYLYSRAGQADRLVVTNYGERSISVVEPETLKEIAHITMEARAIALSYHPTQPLAFVSQDNDKLGYFNMDTLRFERFIATQREPDVSRVILV
jgi:YVTN family beta-propeller protein